MLPPAPPGCERGDLLSAKEDAVILASASPIPARVWHEQFFHFYTGTNRMIRQFLMTGGQELINLGKNVFHK